jgi:hypothetical protein
MKSLKTMLMLAAMVAAMTGWLAAQANAAGALIDKGTKEFSLGAIISSDNVTASGGGGSTTVTTQSVNGSFGYFLDKHSQVGGFLLLDRISASPPSGSTVTTQYEYLEGFYKYHIILDGNPEVVPYFGAYLGTVNVTVSFGGTNESGSGTSYAGAGGIKYFFSERVSGNAELQVGQSTFTIASVSQTDSFTQVLLSLSVYFGG